MIDLPSPALIGVIHLPPLPGSVGQQRSMHELIERACADGRGLRQAAFDAAIIENFGDRPFVRDRVLPVTVASMAVIADQVRRECGIRVGVNVLRNDALAALGIAAAVGASFVRINVHTGVYATDQGIIQGRAVRTLRHRKLLGERIAVLADVHVKHATPLSEPDITRAAKDTAYRGLADGLIVTGPATGAAANEEDLRRVRGAVPDRPLFVGSGVSPETLPSLISLADGVIVGTGLRFDADIDKPIDPDRARAFAKALGRS